MYFSCTFVGGQLEARDSKFAHLVAAAGRCKVKECNEMQLLKCFLWTELHGYLSISNLETNLTAPNIFLSLTYFLRKCEKSVANLRGHEIGFEIVRQSHETWQV